jgi:glycosyltransferase A (GT-A) superfamily protein (DUF2064 family)
MNDAALLIATRLPVPGQTKTRLGARIGMIEAAHLYEGFLCDLAARLAPAAESQGFDLIWTMSPPEGDLPGELERIGIRLSPVMSFLPQSGDTWGVRQDNLMRWAATQGYQRAVLIASDSPQLPAAYITTALDALRTHDVAVGRVQDGGYYLIGMRGYHDILLNVPMSTASAADALIANVREQGLLLVETPPAFDVDVIEDLRLLIEDLAPNGGDCPHTWAILQELGLVR